MRIRRLAPLQRHNAGDNTLISRKKIMFNSATGIGDTGQSPLPGEVLGDSLGLDSLPAHSAKSSYTLFVLGRM